MLLLFAAIACFFLAMLCLGAQHITDDPEMLYRVSVYLIIVGVGLMLAAMATSTLEVGAILESLRYEHRRVAGLLKTEPPGERPTVFDDRGEGSGL